MNKRKSKNKVGDLIGSWVLIEKDSSRIAHWLGHCSTCGLAQCKKISVFRSLKCSCQKSTTVGEEVGLWQIIAKSSTPAYWLAKCKLCGNEKVKRKHEFKKYTCACQGYKKREQNNIEKYGVSAPQKLPGVQEKIKETMLRKYGCEYPLQNEEVKQKTIATSRLRYGVDNPRQNPEVSSKIEKTNQERYGGSTPFASSVVQEKIRATLQEKYGVDSPLQLQEFLEKMQGTNLEKYGSKHVLRLDEFKEKAKHTNLEKYGVENPAQAPEVIEKTKQTNLDKYGVEYTFQDPEVRAKITQTNLDKYGAENPFGASSIRDKIQETLIKKYGVDNYFKAPDFAEKTKQTNLDKYGVDHLMKLPENRGRLNEWCEANPEKLFSSKGELEVLEWIQTYYPSAKKHKQGGHELDIFIPEINLGIEYNGLYHHSAQFKERLYHRNKTEYYEEKKIRVIHIWEHEWQKSCEQIKSFLLSAIGKNSVRLNPRNCQISWSNDKSEIKKSHTLLDNYHIQGHVNTTKYVTNVYYKDELVATATFGKHHRGKDQWILSRFCAKTDYTVRGLLGKVSKMAYRSLQQPIVSWADYRLSQGNGYLKSGWILDEALPPDYFYHKSGYRVISKQSRQKRLVNTPEGMTEYEHAKLDGLERVWDCGKIRFIYDPDKKL